MNKLDWITWKTEESEIINPEQTVETLKEKFLSYNSYMNPVVNETIKHEVLHGGLNKEVFTINGKSPATEVGNKILSDIQEVKDMTIALIENIRMDAESQRKIEKQQLILKIEEKIEKDKKLIKNSQEAQLKYKETPLSDTSESIQTIIDLTQKRIRQLEEKIERLNRN